VKHLSSGVLSLAAADSPVSLGYFSNSSSGKLLGILLLPTFFCHILSLNMYRDIKAYTICHILSLNMYRDMKQFFIFKIHLPKFRKKKNPPLCSPGGYNSPLTSPHLISDSWMKRHGAAASAVPEGTIPLPDYLDNGCSTRSVKRKK